jgi:hypothetical protein
MFRETIRWMCIGLLLLLPLPAEAGGPKAIRALYGTGVLTEQDRAVVSVIRELRPDLAQFAIRIGGRCNLDDVILVMPFEYASYIDRVTTRQPIPELPFLVPSIEFFYIPVQEKHLGYITVGGVRTVPLVRVVGPPVIAREPDGSHPCRWGKRGDGTKKPE